RRQAIEAPEAAGLVRASEAEHGTLLRPFQPGAELDRFGLAFTEHDWRRPARAEAGAPLVTDHLPVCGFEPEPQRVEEVQELRLLAPVADAQSDAHRLLGPGRGNAADAVNHRLKVDIVDPDGLRFRQFLVLFVDLRRERRPGHSYLCWRRRACRGLRPESHAK